MRHKIAVVVLLFVMAVGLVMPAAAGVEVVPTFLFSIRDRQVESRYLVRFVGAESGELAPTGNVLRPLPGEEVVCQVLQVHAGVRLRDFKFQFARVAIPGRGDWIPFALDEGFGHIGQLGGFESVPGGLATPLRFRLTVRDGRSHEVRIFGFKEPIINGLMDLLGLSHDNLVEYSLLYVVPREPESEVTAPTTTATIVDGSRFADAEATTENFRRAAEALAAVQGEVAQAVERLNLNDVTLTEGIQANGTAIAELGARVAAVEAWIRSVEGRQALVPPTATISMQSTSAEAKRVNFQINLPPGVVTRVETFDERGRLEYSRRYAGYIPMNNYIAGQSLCLRLTWEGAPAPDPWKIVRDITDGMTVDYQSLEVR